MGVYTPKPATAPAGVGSQNHRIDGDWGRARTIFDEDLFEALEALIDSASAHLGDAPLTDAERAEIQSELHRVEVGQQAEFQLRRLVVATVPAEDRDDLRRKLRNADLEELRLELGITDAEWEAVSMTTEGTIREVGALLEVSHVAVQRRLNRARRKFAEGLGL